jgi:hypothetical protein
VLGLLSTLDTVAVETFAFFATSIIRTILRLSFLVLLYNRIVIAYKIIV